MQLDPPGVMAEEGEDRSVALIAGAEIEEDDGLRAPTCQRSEADHIAVEGCHRIEIGAADGDFAKGGDFERDGLDIRRAHGESLAPKLRKEKPP